jgi:hypothetical protein
MLGSTAGSLTAHQQHRTSDAQRRTDATSPPHRVAGNTACRRAGRAAAVELYAVTGQDRHRPRADPLGPGPGSGQLYQCRTARHRRLEPPELVGLLGPQRPQPPLAHVRLPDARIPEQPELQAGPAATGSDGAAGPLTSIPYSPAISFQSDSTTGLASGAPLTMTRRGAAARAGPAPHSTKMSAMTATVSVRRAISPAPTAGRPIGSGRDRPAGFTRQASPMS